MNIVFLLILIIFFILLLNQKKCIEGYITFPPGYNDRGGNTQAGLFNSSEFPDNGCDYFIDIDGTYKTYCMDIKKDINYYLDTSKCLSGPESSVYYNGNLGCNYKDERVGGYSMDVDLNCNSFVSEGNNLNAICSEFEDMSISCYNKLVNSCSNTNIFKCAECAGNHQQLLEEAGCNNKNISEYCANSQLSPNLHSVFYKNSLPINNLDKNQILYDNNKNLLYFENKGNRVEATKTKLNIPKLKLWGDNDYIENLNTKVCNVNGSCLCKSKLCNNLSKDGYFTPGLGGVQVCINKNTNQEVNHEELCKLNKGIFKSQLCLNAKEGVDCM